MNKWGVSILAALLLLCLAAGAMAAEERVRLGDYADVSYTLQADRYGTSLPDVVEDGQSLFLQLAFDLIVQDETYLLRKAYQNGEISPDTIFTVDIGSLHLMNDANYPTSYDDEDNIASDAGVNIFRWWVDEEAGQICLRYYENVYSDDGNVSNTKVAFDGSLDTSSHNDDGQLRFEVNGETETLIVRQEYELNKEAGIPYYSTDASSYLVDYTVTLTLDQNMSLSQGTTGNLYGAALTLVDTVAADGALTGELFGDATVTAPAGEQAAIASVNNGSVNTLTLSSPDGILNKGTYTFVYRMKVDSEAALAKLEGYTEAQRTNAVELKENGASLRTPLTAAASIGWDEVTVHQFGIDKNAFTDHTEAYGGAYMDERDKKYYVDFRVTVYIKEPFSTFTVVDNVNYALSFRSPDERPVTLEGVDTSDSFLTNDPKTANLTRVDAIVTNTVDGGRNTITLTAPEGEMLPPGAYQLRVPADITSAVRSAQAKNYPQYYSNTASLIKVDDYAPNVSKEWKSLVPTYETPTKAGGYEVDPVTGKLFFYEGKPLIRWDVYFGWNFYDKTTFIDTLTGMDLLVNSDYPFEIHSFDSRNTYKERLYSLTDLTDTSFIDFNDAGNGFTFTTENLDINSDGTYVKLYKLVYFATPSVNADGSYVTEGIKNGYKVIHTDPFGNGFADGPITGEEEPTMTSNARLIVEKRHVIERTDSLTQWKITCKNSNKTPFELFGDLDIVDLVPRGQTPIGEVTIHYSDKWPIEVEMVCGNNQKVPLTEGTHYQILKSHPKHDFGENGKYGFAVDLDMEAVAAILEEKNATTFETIDVTCYLNNETHAPGQNYRIKNDGWLNYTNQGTELVEGINAHYDRGFATRRKETPAYGDYYDPTAFRNYTVCTVNGNSAQAFTGGYDDNPANGDGVEEIRWKIFIGAREFGNDGDPITVTVTDTLSDNQMLPSYAGRPLKDLFLIEAEDAPGYIIVPDSVSVSGNTFTLTFTIPGGGWAGNSKDKSKDIYITYHTMLKPEAIRDAMDEVPIDAAEIVLNYSNTATISWNGESYTLPTSRGSTSLNSSMMDKTAEFLQSSGRKVEYTIEMNPFGLDLDRNSDVILLEDQMGAGKDVFTYVDGSFRVVNTRVGRQLSAASSASATSYVLTMAEDGKSFTLDVPDNTPLKLTYQAKTTLPVGTKDVSLINNACLAGRKPQAESITFNVTSSNQSGSYSVLPHEAGIRLLKISSEGAGSNSPTFLPGAQFRVTTLDQDFGPGASETLTTKAGGVIEITKVPEGAMILVIEETMAPDGYRLGAAPWKWCYVLLSENAEFSDEDMAALKAAVGCSVTTIRAGSYVEDTITNDPVSLVVRKVDPDGNLLTGAMFTLKKGSTPIDHSYTHNAPGELLFEDLTAGSYTLEETEAPDGFDISEEDPWSFTLDANGSVVLTETYQDLTLSEDGLYLEVLNVPEYNAEGEIQLGAVKTLNGRTLEAEQFSFELYDAEGNEIETVKNAADGSIAFTTLHYTEEDLEKSPIAYTVKEVKGNAAGYTYDEAEYTVNVTLTDNGDGTITATADKEAAEVAFTNSYKAEGEIQLGAVKTLNGRTLEAEQFSFELYDAEGDVIETVKNAADGSITFTTLTYTREDLEKSPIAYTVKEVKGDAAGYTYDEAEYTVNVTLTDNGDGTITATADKEAAEVAFTNSYKAEGEIQLGAVKTLTGGTLEAEQFSFELLDAEDNVIETVKNAADGSIAFTMLHYTEEDLEKSPIAYTVKEVKGNAAGYTYDEAEYTVNVTLKDNGDGTITATADKSAAEVAFTNSYKAEGEIQLGAVKTLNGRELEAEQFSFELLDAEGNMIETVKNAADGSIAFTTLTYTGEDLEKSPIAYTVKEVKGNAAGYTYDEAEYTVTVTLTDNGDGTITATADKEAAEVAFANSYKAEGEIQLGAVKTLTGGTLEAEQFSFELYDAEGSLIETVKNAADGSIAFTTLHYTEEDLEKSPIAYTVKEVKGDAAGYTYDETEYTVNVTLTDDGDGTITATADKEAAEVAFANAYEAKGEIQLGAVKTLNGRTLEAEQFSFELLDAEGDVIETVKNAADGGITFTTLTYTGEDLEKSPIAYTVKEVKGNAAGYTYDETGYTVTVTLTDNGDGTITAAADKEAAEVAFANAYEAAGEWSPTAIKTVNGAEPREDQVYEFILTDAAGNTIRAENAGGEITFGTLTYGLSDVGQTYTYTVREITESTDMMAADESIYTVNVTVSDNHDGTLNVEPVITRNGEPAEEIRFENTLYASLTISKMVEGCETDRTFRFTVELFHADGTEAEGEYAYTGDAEGMIRSGDTIGLAHDQSVTISGLLPGMRYTVTEAASAAFEVTVNGEAGGSIEGELPEDGAEVSFVNELMTTEFMVTKSWQGGDGGAIELTLYANGKKLDPQPDYTRDGNVYRYVDLPMYDERDQLIVYYAKEKYVDGFLTIYVNVPPYAGKTKAIYNGGTIINKAVVKADFAVRKTWSGLTEGEAAPEIELVLYCNGEPTDIRTPKPDRNGWYKYYNLPGEVNGQPAVYTVREQPLSGFVTRYTLKDGTPADHADNGGTIINARIPQNGDETSLALWVALMGASAAMLTLLRRRRRA